LLYAARTSLPSGTLSAGLLPPQQQHYQFSQDSCDSEPSSLPQLELGAEDVGVAAAARTHIPPGMSRGLRGMVGLCEEYNSDFELLQRVLCRSAGDSDAGGHAAWSVPSVGHLIVLCVISSTIATAAIAHDVAAWVHCRHSQPQRIQSRARSGRPCGWQWLWHCCS
jgi:hypothetical protein